MKTKTQSKRLAGASLLLALLASPAAQAAVTETRSTAYVYDANGQVIRELIEPQDSTLCLVTEYSYDGHGNHTSTQPHNCNDTSAIPGVDSEAPKPTGSALFTTGTVQARYDHPGLNSATERKITTNALGHQRVQARRVLISSRADTTPFNPSPTPATRSPPQSPPECRSAPASTLHPRQSPPPAAW